MPYTTIVAGTTITAAWANASVRDQVVTPFASAAARASAISSPLEGMVSHLADVNSLTVYSGAAWSTIGPVHGALTAWTPAIVQSGAVTCTVTRAVYTRTGRWISGTFTLAVTGTGSASNVITVSLPFTAVGTGADYFAGNGKIYDASSTFSYIGMVVLHSTTTMKFMHVQTGAAETYMGAAGSPFTPALASGDVVTGQFQYEAAADA